ncbi:lamin tail domain-containing protein [Salinibacter grassmerensis]|uniref:lamin tail domain-containing protein n=1 Tax=Salinibacter grassmerensis TaxID=3040353 RepID=UPI0021E945D1|nr:lamin tail domain-containing protein [Salinibacter grassmerensis]
MRLLSWSVVLLLLGGGTVFSPRSVAAQPAPGDVVINEVLYAPSPSTNEFVEFYNRSGGPIALEELAFADANQSYEPVAATDTMLSDGAHVVLVRDPEAFTAAFSSATFLTPDEWPALNNGGDTVYLRHTPSSTSLDSVPYDPSWGGRDGRSLERIDPGGPSDTDTNFASSDATSGATPGTQNSVYAPDETPPSPVRVVPSQTGDSVTVVFSEPVASTSVSPEAFRFDSADAPSIVATRIDDGSPAQVRCALANPLSTGEYRLVATGISDPRGNVQTEDTVSFSYVVATPPTLGDIVVSEIMYAPSLASNEFIEVYNRSDKVLDLGALHYADDERDFAPAAPPLTPFHPGQYAVLVRDEEAFEETYPSVKFTAPEGWDALNNGGDTVILRHAPSSTQIDSVPYAPSWGGSGGRSLERIDPRGSSDKASNFASSAAPNGATPGAQNSRFAPDTMPPQPTFAEQVDSLGAAVVFGEPVRSASIRPERFQFEDVTVTQTQVQADSIVRLSLSDRPTAEAVVVTGVQDQVGNRLDRASLPFARRPTPGTLVLNELMFDPLADDFDDRPNQVEYVELRNLADHSLTLTGLALTDRPTEDGTADTLRVGRHRGLAPGGFAVVAAAPRDTVQPRSSQLAAAFPDAPLLSDSVTFLPVQSASLSLRNDGDRVRVHRRDTAVVADVTYSPDWHAAGLADPKGTALERISPTAEASAADNWTSSTASAGGTPGAPNDVSLAPPDDAPNAPGLAIHPSPFSIERDGATRIQYTLPDRPSLVRVRIYDARGRRVRTLEEARLAGRSGELVWNGRDDEGDRVRIGPYVVLLEAVQADGGTTTELKETVVMARPLN